jgi:hypothetical protein
MKQRDWRGPISPGYLVFNKYDEVGREFRDTLASHAELVGAPHV